MNTQPKPNASQLNIDHLPSRADDLERYINTHVDELAPHLDELRTYILETYGRYARYESEWLLDACDNVAILASSGKFQQDIQRSTVDSVSAKMPEQNEPLTDASVIDSDSMRIAIRLREFPTYRMWVFAHQLARATDNSGSVKREALAAYLQQHEIVCTDSSFRNILERGAGLDSVKYWNISPDSQTIFLASAKTLNSRYASYLRRKKLYACIDTNRPGNTRIYVDLHGGIEAVEARVFNAWFSLAAEQHEKRFKAYNVQISHDTLRDLWGRSRNTLKKWMRSAGIKMQAAYAETDIIVEDKHTKTRKDLVPDYAYPILTKNGRQLEAWRLPNIYTPKPVNRHGHNGNRHKVRRAVNSKLFQPADLMRGGFKRSALTKRIYFHDTYPIKKVNGHSTETLRDGYKNLQSHLPKHGDVTTRRHYVNIGKRQYRRKSPITIFEYSTGNLWRDTDDRDFRTERSPEFRAFRSKHRIYRMGGKYA